MRVQVLSGAFSDELVNRLREHDPAGLVAVAVVDRAGLAAMVIATGHDRTGERAADVVLDDGQPLAGQIDRLWAERIAPFARHMAGLTPMKVAPASLHPHDLELLAAAQRLLDRLRDALTDRGLDDGRWTYDHIGSTAVPGLLAKRFIDLQIGAAALPEEDSAADEVLAAAGFLATGLAARLTRGVPRRGDLPRPGPG